MVQPDEGTDVQAAHRLLPCDQHHALTFVLESPKDAEKPEIERNVNRIQQYDIALVFKRISYKGCLFPYVNEENTKSLLPLSAEL